MSIRTIITIGFVLPIAIGCGRSHRVAEAQASSAAVTTVCHNSDTESDHFLRVIRSTVRDPKLRNTFHVPNVEPNQVSLVSDPALCARAGEALASLATSYDGTKRRKPAAGPVPLYVFTVGESYAVVYLPENPEADCDFIWYFDRAWKHSAVGCSQ